MSILTKVRRTHRQAAESKIDLAGRLAEQARYALNYAEGHAVDAQDHHAAQAEYHARENVEAIALQSKVRKQLAALDTLGNE